MSPLCVASYGGKIEVVKELVKAKADLNLQTKVSDSWPPHPRQHHKGDVGRETRAGGGFRGLSARSAVFECNGSILSRGHVRLKE